MLTPEELARATNRSPEVIRRWIRCGRIPATPVGRFYLCPTEAVSLVCAMPRTHRRRPTAAA